MKRLIFAALVACAPMNAAAQTNPFDDTKTVEQWDRYFTGMAKVCASDYGFTVIPTVAPDVMVSRMRGHAYMTGGMLVEMDWRKLLPVSEAENERASNLAADYLLAAHHDPSQKAEAAKRVGDMMVRHIGQNYTKCEAMSRDPYLSKAYLTGVGNSTAIDEQIRAEARDMIEEGITE